MVEMVKNIGDKVTLLLLKMFDKIWTEKKIPEENGFKILNTKINITEIATIIEEQLYYVHH